MPSKLFSLVIVNILKEQKEYYCVQSSRTVNTDKNTIFIVPNSLMIIPVTTYNFNNFVVGLNMANISPGS